MSFDTSHEWFVLQATTRLTRLSRTGRLVSNRPEQWNFWLAATHFSIAQVAVLSVPCCRASVVDSGEVLQTPLQARCECGSQGFDWPNPNVPVAMLPCTSTREATGRDPNSTDGESSGSYRNTAEAQLALECLLPPSPRHSPPHATCSCAHTCLQAHTHTCTSSLSAPFRWP